MRVESLPGRALLCASLLCAVLEAAGCEEGTAQSELLTPPPYNASGTLDTDFGGTGIVAADYSSSSLNDGGFALRTLAGDGSVVGGYVTTAGTYEDAAIWRFNSRGVLDVAFNGSGLLSLDLPFMGTGELQNVNAIAIQPDGNIVAAGKAQTSNSSPVLWRIYSSGAGLDTSFNTTGYNDVTPTGSTGKNSITAVAIDSHGRIVATGYSIQGSNGSDMAVWRLNPHGTLDTGFNTDGVFLTGTGLEEAGYALAVDGNDNIYVAGSTSDDISVWKLLGTNGALDTSFNTTGQYTYASGLGTDGAQAIALDSAGWVGLRTY
jgi:uncharacterized delta-60 repeat protein